MIRTLFFSSIFLVIFSGGVHGMENATLRLVFFDAPPFSYEKDGQAHGFAIDLLNEILINKMNLKVEYEILPWGRAQKMVKDGGRDGFVNVPTDNRKNYTIASKESLLSFNFILFANPNSKYWADLKKVRSLKDLDPYNNCHVLGTHWGKMLKTEGMKTFLVRTPRQAFLMVNNKRCDTFVAPSLMGRWAINKLGLSKSVSGISEAVLDRFAYHLMIGKKSDFRNILPQFDQVVKTMKSEGEIESILKKYELELLQENL